MSVQHPKQARRLELVPGDSVPPPPAGTDDEPLPAASSHGAAETDAHDDGAPRGAAAHARLPSHEAAVVRSLARTMGAHGLAIVALCATAVARWGTGGGNVALVVATVLGVGLGGWSLLAGWHVARVGKRVESDAREIVSAFGYLRSIVILKATVLFLALATSCFALSVVASLLTLP